MKQGRKVNGDSGHGRACWRRGRDGGGRGERELPVGGGLRDRGGRWRWLHGGQRPAAVLCRCGGIPARRGGDGRARELRWDESKRIRGLVEGGASSVDGSAWRCGRRPWRAWRALAGRRRRQAQPARPWRHPHAREAMEGERGAAASSSVRRAARAALSRCHGQIGHGGQHRAKISIVIYRGKISGRYNPTPLKKSRPEI